MSVCMFAAALPASRPAVAADFGGEGYAEPPEESTRTTKDDERAPSHDRYGGVVLRRYRDLRRSRLRRPQCPAPSRTATRTPAARARPPCRRVMPSARPRVSNATPASIAGRSARAAARLDRRPSDGRRWRHRASAPTARLEQACFVSTAARAVLARSHAISLPRLARGSPRLVWHASVKSCYISRAG